MEHRRPRSMSLNSRLRGSPCTPPGCRSSVPFPRGVASLHPVATLLARLRRAATPEAWREVSRGWSEVAAASERHPADKRPGSPQKPSHPGGMRGRARPRAEAQRCLRSVQRLRASWRPCGAPESGWGGGDVPRGVARQKNASLHPRLTSWHPFGMPRPQRKRGARGAPQVARGPQAARFAAWGGVGQGEVIERPG